ncbi:MAG: hypothetical protein ABL986_09490 [Vicinamibacterales bacterium]
MGTRVFKLLLFFHRWVGVALCALFLLWFPSGIGMMYWGMPSVTPANRLAHAPVLNPSEITLSPQELVESIGVDAAPAQIRLNSFDGRPVYRVGGAGRGGGGGRLVYADTGEEQKGAAPKAMRERAVARWAGRAVGDATVESMTDPDQWTVGNQLRNLRPLWKYSYPGGEDVYIGESGEVLMHTTRVSRLQAYVSAVPHWLYFTPLRKHQPFWIRFATYTAMVGTAGAVIGVVLGVWLYSPARKKYRFAGAPSSIPYRGQKRWHTIFGLVFGLATVTWTLSGSLAFLPFPTPQRAPPQAQPGQNIVGGVGNRQNQGIGGARGRGANPNLATSLRGRSQVADFTLHPRDLLLRNAGLGIKEIELASFAGRPFYVANLADGTSRRFGVNGLPIETFDPQTITEIVKRTASDAGAVETRVVDEYDYFYFDRTRQRPLPVILALMHDADGTRHYIDPKTGTIAGTYSNRNWARRFFYNGLHSLSFPWLYNYRPLWDIVVITFMIGGTALCVTALVLAWRAVGKRLRRVTVLQSAS